MHKFVTIIPARSGSKSIPDKNILRLGKYPLIAYSIAAAKLSKYSSRVIVSTDSEKYASIAKDFGAEVPFIRPLNFSGDKSVDRDFLVHAMQWFLENESNLPEMWIHLRPTTPLRNPEIMDRAIDYFLENPEATSLRSAHKAPESPMKWFIKEKNYFKGFVDSQISNLPKEMFKETYIPNGYIDIVKSSNVMKNFNIHGNKILAFSTPVVNEVDSIEEFEYISFQLKKQNLTLQNYLDKIYKNGR